MKGFPDDFGVSIFPQFGPLTEIVGSADVVSLTVTPIISIAAKGVIYTAHIMCIDVNVNMTSSVVLTVDGEILTYSAPAILSQYQFIGDDQYPLYLTYYNEYEPHFRMNVRPGLTFTSSFVLSYNNIAVPNVTVAAKAVYANIV